MDTHTQFAAVGLATITTPPLTVTPPFASGFSSTAIDPPYARSASTLVFVDATVPDYRQLVSQFAPNAVVQVLDGNADAIAQITRTLQQFTGVSQLHLMSHASTGAIQFGHGVLNAATLPTYASKLQTWADALSEDADLFLYGCNLAQDPVGQALVAQIHHLTQADIAASTDITGASGNWNLEYQLGTIAPNQAFIAPDQPVYDHDLGIVINEVRRAGMFANTESIELLLTTDYTATQLEALFWGDSTAAADTKFGAYQFENLVSIAPVFRAGTLIAIGGTTVIPTEDVTYTPLPTGSDEDWNLRLQVTGNFLQIVNGSGDFAATDVAWVDTSDTGTGTLHAINWDATPGALGSAATVTIAAPANPGTVSFLGDDTQVAIAALYAINTTNSLGLPNGGTNSTYIAQLRSWAQPAQPTDFDRNGTPDLVWYDYLTGTVQMQLMIGALPGAVIPLATLGAGWQLMDLADFDGNQYADLLWQNVATGENAIWLMQGTAIAQGLWLPAVPASSDWRMVGVADFDSNGTPDILWRSPSAGVTGLWHLDWNGTGLDVLGWTALPGRAAAWVVSGVADLDRDGAVDLVWRDRDRGTTEIWRLAGATYLDTIALPDAPPNWVLHELADWTGDGSIDLLWQEATTGAIGLWSLNQGVFDTAIAFTTPGSPVWVVLDQRDWDSNGSPDLLVRNYLTGENAVWQITGTATTNVVDLGTWDGWWDAIA